jgi:hypothetical protein
LGKDITHFQKFLICSSYDKPYGLLSGVKIFTVLVVAAAAAVADDNIDGDNSNNTYEIEIVIQQTISLNL